MKFYLCMAVAAILMSATANAQHVNIGIKGGLNYYNVHNDNGVKYDAKAGLHLGLLGHIHLSHELAFQPELLYSTQGGKFSEDNSTTKLNLGYINVPLLIQYMFDNGFRLEAGPQVGFLVNAKAETGNIKVDVKKDIKSTDFALAIGVGYIGASGFGVDARYNLGLSNINENSYSSVKSTNRGFQLGVFYLFGHK